MRAERRRLLGRGDGEAQHRIGVAGALGVVGQPRELLPAVERPQRAAVQLDTAVGRERLLHREPGELVPEGDAPRRRR